MSTLAIYPTSASAVKTEERIRVVCIIPTLTRGGTERQLIELLRGLDRNRFDPTLIIFGADGNGLSYSLNGAVDRVLSLNIAPGGNFRARNAPGLVMGMIRLTRMLQEIRPHVVHAFLPAPAVIGSIACKLAGVSVFLVGRRTMASYHRRGSKVLTWFDRLPLWLASGLIGNCDAIAREAVTTDRIPSEKAFTISNGVDTKSFRQGRDAALRAELGFAPDNVVFGVIANFHNIKRHADFVLAAEKILKDEPQARFLMIGADYGTLPELRKQISERGMDACFVIVSGTSEPERYYRAMDVYVCASEVEGMSNAIMEAMASGKPVIATNVGGNSELVSNGESGFIVAPYAPNEIAACASMLISDSGLRSRMGLRGLRRVEERFSVNVMVKAHEKLYSKLLKSLARA
jgi:glycosyltransferase involved in cell wall biosynthesis